MTHEEYIRESLWLIMLMLFAQSRDVAEGERTEIGKRINKLVDAKTQLNLSDDMKKRKETNEEKN